MNSSHPNAAPTKAIWYFDVISPFSYLALGEIEELAKRVQIAYRPVLFAALLDRRKNLGPAEIPSKRLHTYRLCTFEAQRRGIVFRFPTHHPFNPLKPLRLLVALGATPSAVRTVMDRIWRDGLDPSTEQSWLTTCSALAIDPAAAASLVEASVEKAKLRANTQGCDQSWHFRGSDAQDRRRIVLGPRRIADGAGLSREARSVRIRRNAPPLDDQCVVHPDAGVRYHAT